MLRDRRSRRRRRRRRTLLSDVGCVRNPSGLNDVVVVVKTTLCASFVVLFFTSICYGATFTIHVYRSYIAKWLYNVHVPVLVHNKFEIMFTMESLQNWPLIAVSQR